MLPDHWNYAPDWASNADPLVWPILAFVAFVCYLLCTNAVSKDTNLPCVGVSNRPFSYTLATVRSLVVFRPLLTEAYSKYLSRGLPCRIPDFIFGPLILLPTTKLKWMLSQPTRILDPVEAQHEIVQMHELLWYADVPFEKPMHGSFPRKWMASRFELSKNALMHEIGLGIGQAWGTDTENWNEVNTYKTLLPVVAQATWESLVGQPYCRDSSLWHYGQLTADFIFPIAQIVRLFPPFMRPLVARVAGLPLQYFYRQLSARLIPIVHQRKEDLDQAERNGNLESDRSLPNDYMSWLVQRERQQRTWDENSGHKICSLLAGLNLAASQSLTILTSNTIRALIHSPKDRDYLGQLRREIEEALGEEDNQWTKTSLSKMTGVGSSIREAMRLYPALSTAPVRTLCQDLPIDCNGEIRLKKGTRISIAAYSIHTDEALYPNPYDFDAFRFAQPRKSHDCDANEQERAPSPTLLSFTNTWFGWGAGKSACPGRFLANDVLKLLLARILLSYDVRPVGIFDGGFDRTQHTKSACIGSLLIPNLESTMLIRRRAVAAV